jgi:hypothetical protein
MKTYHISLQKEAIVTGLFFVAIKLVPSRADRRTGRTCPLIRAHRIRHTVMPLILGRAPFAILHVTPVLYLIECLSDNKL